MPEAIIASLRFQGKAFGDFRPPPQTFSVSHELIFSAARFTIDGAAEGRTHLTQFSIDSSGGGNNSGKTEVPDREPTTAAAFTRLSRLLPGYEYKLSVSSDGFNISDEDVSVAVDLLELDSTVAKVTRNVLRDAESDLGINAITFGISEASFTHFFAGNFTEPVLEVGTTPYLKLSLMLQRDDTVSWPFVHIDVSTKEIVVSGQLLLVFHRAGDKPLYNPVAVVSAVLNVYCQPAMVTTTNDTLQIQFRRAGVVEGSTLVDIRDKTAETGILHGYTSIPDFEEDANRYLNQIISNTGPLGFALPAYLASRPMPDHWNHVLNMELYFECFDYRSVKVHDFPISYLFIVFSVRSLNLPPPCYCESELAALREANTPSAASDSLPSQGTGTKQTAQSSLTKKWDEVVPLRLDYYHIRVPAQIGAFGISQRSFREIARPYASMGHDESTSTGGSVYASARSWFRTTLQTAEITSDGIRAVIDVTAEGSAKAAVRDRCGHDVLSASTRLRIRCEDTSIRWSLRINRTKPYPPELTIEADPVANVGDINVTFAALVPQPPLDQVRNWVITTVANTLLRPALSKLVTEKARIRLIRTIENNSGIRLVFVDDKFFPGEAAVVLGEFGVRIG